jgi:cytidylate kinase
MIDNNLRKNNSIKIIVDGSNESGKSTVCNMIKSILTGLTIIETHDFGHMHVIRELQKSPELLYKHSDWLHMAENERIISKDYICKRESALIKYLCLIKYDDILVERLLLTTQVYSQILFQSRINNKINIKKLEELGFFLIFTSAPFDVIIKRLEENKKIKKRIKKTETPEHLINTELTHKKLEMYEKEYAKINMEKVKIDTSVLGKEALYEYLKKIIVSRYK